MQQQLKAKSTDPDNDVQDPDHSGVVLKIEDIRPAIADEVPANENTQHRYWMLKLWLYGLITLKLVSIEALLTGRYLYLTGADTATPGTMQISHILIAIAIAQIVFAIALLNFQKWGFWGMVMSGLAVLLMQINLGTATVLSVMSTLFGLSILYGLLRPGGKNDAWFRLS